MRKPKPSKQLMTTLAMLNTETITLLAAIQRGEFLWTTESHEHVEVLLGATANLTGLLIHEGFITTDELLDLELASVIHSKVAKESLLDACYNRHKKEMPKLLHDCNAALQPGAECTVGKIGDDPTERIANALDRKLKEHTEKGDPHNAK